MKKEMKKEMREAKAAKEAQDLLDSQFQRLHWIRLTLLFC